MPLHPPEPSFRFSVVVLNWNGRHLLRECLDSVLQQQDGSLEIIVVDNGSTDGSVDFVRESYGERIRLLGLGSNQGWAGGNNRRIEGRGCNTDVEGFLAGCAGVELRGRRVAVLGTGGAARAVALAARRSGAAVTCYGRDRERTDALAARLGIGAALRPVPAGAWDVLGDATPVGTHPDTEQSAFPESTYEGSVAYDLVYNPARTRFLREAAARGCRTIGGLGMLVAQARRQIELWTGLRPDPGPMREAAEWTLARRVERA